MRRTWAPILALLLAATAAAGYDEGSAVTADAPVQLDGRADAAVVEGVATLLAPDARTPLTFTLLAQRLELTVVNATAGCGPVSPPGADCASPRPAAVSFTLTDASVSVRGSSTASRLLVSNDPAASDKVGISATLTAIVPAGAALDATPAPLRFSPYQDGWAAEAESFSEHVYEAAAERPFVAGRGATLAANGTFHALAQGQIVRVTGTADGTPFDRVFTTRYAPEESSFEFLVLDAVGATLSAQSSAASFAAYGTPSVYLQRGPARLTGAEGSVVQDGVETPADGALTLAGPVRLDVTGVHAGEPMRLDLAVSDDKLATAPPEGDDGEAARLAAAGAVGAGAATLLAALVYFWPRVKLAATLLVLPLYTRIERTEVLHHEKRDEIYELIRATPGIHAHEIGERARIGWGTTVYHLKMLESHDLVVSKKSGRYKRFYVNTGEYTKKKDVYAALRNETAKAVAEFIVNHPGASQKDLCAAVGIQPSLASWHVEKLESVGLVKRVKDGRQVRYFAGPAWSELNVRLTPGGGAEGVAET